MEYWLQSIYFSLKSRMSPGCTVYDSFITGEYLGWIYTEVKGRPSYIISETNINKTNYAPSLYGGATEGK